MKLVTSLKRDTSLNVGVCDHVKLILRPNLQQTSCHIQMETLVKRYKAPRANADM